MVCLNNTKCSISIIISPPSRIASQPALSVPKGIKNNLFFVVVVPDQTLRNMRHKKGAHILKGMIARCERCNQHFDTNTLIWNAITKLNNKLLDPFLSFFKDDVQFPLTKEQVDYSHTVSL
jgi:hypothetical protein